MLEKSMILYLLLCVIRLRAQKKGRGVERASVFLEKTQLTGQNDGRNMGF
jgi:hypothetical protein